MGNYGQIYVNLKGREPYGSVEPRDFDPVRDEIVKRLGELRDPQTKQKVVARIFRTEELFWGPLAKDAPDVAFLLEDKYKALGTLEFASNKVVDPAFGNSGDHRMDGFIAMLGKNIRAGVPILNANIMDVAPTILYLMGLPIPEDLDGHVITAPLKEDLLTSQVIMQTAAIGSREQVEPDYTDEEAEEVKERLRALGYLG
jgi:predicted AlkP superfamily phosphohydrolase/phosphomutase